MILDGVDYVTTGEAIERLGPDVTREMVSNWAVRRLVLPVGRYPGGESLFRWADIQEAEYRTRSERRGRPRPASEPAAGLQDAEQEPIMTARDLQMNAARRLADRCTIRREDGRPCHRVLARDAPISACTDHLVVAHRYVEEIIKGVRAGNTKIPPPDPSRFRPEVVYYIRFGDRIKVGYSSDLASRANAIPSDELLAAEPGGLQLEQMRHKQFAADRIYRNREWFRPSADLMSHIEMLRAHYGDPEQFFHRSSEYRPAM